MLGNIDTITNGVTLITFEYEDGSQQLVPKKQAKINDPGTGNIVYFIDHFGYSYPLDYTVITSPVSASRAALATTLQNYLD